MKVIFLEQNNKLFWEGAWSEEGETSCERNNNQQFYSSSYREKSRLIFQTEHFSSISDTITSKVCPKSYELSVWDEKSHQRSLELRNVWFASTMIHQTIFQSQQNDQIRSNFC